ncbi:MAG: ABC transporter ATP-binding protein [Eubacteriales bacterium]|nr:ABC transporter ATP-binding protein [Eubacteriales bacterium]
MLKVEHLTVRYGHIQALEDVSFEVKKNQIISLIGANGAGKTTSLMSISGMVPKIGGSVVFDGTDISRQKAHMITRNGLSHVPEGRRVFPGLTVEENLVTGTIGAGKISKAVMRERMEEMYELFPRMRERASQTAGTLSGGEQQMLAIARGLMNDPKLIMLDEPSLGLAPKVVDEIFELILKIRDMGKTVLLIEQNAALALSISDYAYVLELGHITLHGTGQELLHDPMVMKAYLGI